MSKVTKKRSREFEIWATQIEGALVPTGAAIKSPDRLQDKFTGQWREVDASVRYRFGSVDILITIECRERSRAQDTTWIEQLATKRLHIGADRTIAVSSTPFTAAAQKAAATHGISLRRIADLTAEELSAAAQEGGIEVQVSELILECGGISITCEGAAHVDDVTKTAYEADGWDAEIFTVGDRTLSFADLLRGGKHAAEVPEGATRMVVPPKTGLAVGGDPLWDHFRDTPQDGTRVTNHFVLRFDNHEPSPTVSTSSGIRKVSKVEAQVTAWSSVEKVAPSRISDYSNEQRVLGRFVEHKLDFGGVPLRVISHPSDVVEK
jgi:hypothetical protein